MRTTIGNGRDSNWKENLAILMVTPSSRFSKTLLAALLGDLQDAEKWCGIVKGLPGGEVSAIAFRARALAQCDRYQKAKFFILDAVRNYPNELDILIACGDLMMWYPKSETAMSNAVTVYRRAVEILEIYGKDIQRQREIERRLLTAQANLAEA